MKSMKSLLLVMLLSLAVMAGCNVTVNEAPDTAPPSMENESMDEDEGVMDDEEMGIDDEDESDTEDSDNTETDEEDNGLLHLEIKDGVGMIEVEPKVDPEDFDIDPETVEVNIMDDEVMMEVKQ